MSLDLFSSIDFFLSKFSFLSSMTFMLSLFGVIIFFKSKISFNRKISFLSALNNILLQNFSKSLKKKVGSLLFLLTLFYFIFMSNLLGLFPFAFGWTSHMMLILQLSLFMWMMVNLSNIFFKFISYWSHLVPQGVPLILGMFLAKIELMSKLIRPLTLSLRLGMKITTGHVLLALMSVMGVNSSIFFLMLFLAVFYFFFELFVMFIQAVVYSLLMSQYYEE